MIDPDRDARAVLTRLGLNEDDVEALALQGFVAAEDRQYRGARLGPYFKLRWRMHGRQRTKYLGRDAQLAEVVANAIADLQRENLLAREVARMMTAARKSLQETKKQMAKVMANRGRYYHGYTCRKRRTNPASATEAER